MARKRVKAKEWTASVTIRGREARKAFRVFAVASGADDPFPEDGPLPESLRAPVPEGDPETNPNSAPKEK